VTVEPSWLDLVAGAVGPVSEREPLGGSAWRLTVGGRVLVAKTGPGVSDEATGLRTLAAAVGAPPVPEVVLAQGDLLITEWVPQAPQSRAHSEALGRSLGRLHSAPWPAWGGGSPWIGGCQVDASEVSSGATFYGRRMLGLAYQCGLTAEVERVVNRLAGLFPPGGPAPVHGDLWWGNVLWGSDGRAWLIDPWVHGGHPEEDLAMLQLFGRLPDGLLGAYAEAAPLREGWQERRPLFSLYPLLVHTVLFGGSYRDQAVRAARRYR
jgi:fructosamine-3-kinase